VLSTDGKCSGYRRWGNMTWDQNPAELCTPVQLECSFYQNLFGNQNLNVFCPNLLQLMFYRVGYHACALYLTKKFIALGISATAE
jgi:hypothetical protein